MLASTPAPALSSAITIGDTVVATLVVSSTSVTFRFRTDIFATKAAASQAAQVLRQALLARKTIKKRRLDDAFPEPSPKRFCSLGIKSQGAFPLPHADSCVHRNKGQGRLPDATTLTPPVSRT